MYSTRSGSKTGGKGHLGLLWVFVLLGTLAGDVRADTLNVTFNVDTSLFGEPSDPIIVVGEGANPSQGTCVFGTSGEFEVGGGTYTLYAFYSDKVRIADSTYVDGFYKYTNDPEGDVVVNFTAGQSHEARFFVRTPVAPERFGDRSRVNRLCGSSPTATTTTIPLCPAARGGRFSQCHGQRPRVTNVVVPPVVPEQKVFPVDVSFADPGGAVTTIVMEEESFGTFVNVGSVAFPPVPDGGTKTVGIQCSGFRGGRPPGFNANFVIRAKVGDAEGSSSDPSAPQAYTCVAKAFVTKLAGAIAESLALGAILATAISAGASLIPAPQAQGGAKLMALIAVLLKLFKATAEAWNSDPPDPNFTILAAATPPPYAPIVADPGIPTELAAAVNALASNWAQGIGFGEALLASYERAQGAGEGGSTEWFTKQMEASGRWAGEWRSAIEAHPTNATNFQSAWRAVGYPEITITADEVRALQEEVSVNGLPDFMYEALRQVGADDETVDALTTEVLNADPEAAAKSSFPGTLTSPAMAEGVMEALDGFGRFATAFTAARCTAPCDDSDACTIDTCSNRDCRYDTIAGVDAICSSCQAGLQSRVCAGQSVPAAVGQRLTQACALRAKALTSKPKSAKRLRRLAAQKVQAAKTLVKKASKKHKNPLSRDCAALVRDTLRAPL